MLQNVLYNCFIFWYNIWAKMGILYSNKRIRSYLLILLAIISLIIAGPVRSKLNSFTDKKLSELTAFIETAEQICADVNSFIKVVQKYEHITELTPEIMHELIEKIVVHAPDKSSGYRTQKIEIHYRFNVAVTTAVADSMKYDKKRKAA